MKGARWFSLVLAATVGMAVGVAAINRAVDPYGIYGDPSGRQLHVSSNGRMTKFLFGMKYIPRNFSGLLLGSSITENWNTALLSCARVYNASLAGANISEQALIARSVFAQRRLQLVVVTVFPYMTETHGRKSSQMVPAEYWGGLGSVALVETYLARLLEQSFHRAPRDDAFGVSPDSPQFAEPAGAASAPRPETVDAEGLADFVAVVREARASSERVVALIPPYFQPVWERQRTFFEDYNRRALAAFEPSDVVIDFNQPKYLNLTKERENFPDGAHLKRAAADIVAQEMDRILTNPDLARHVRDYL